MTRIRVPKRFFNDCRDRGIDVPAVVAATRGHYVIDGADSRVDSLYDDAEFYSDRTHFNEPQLFGLVMSARATLRALDKAAGLVADPG